MHWFIGYLHAILFGQRISFLVFHVDATRGSNGLAPDNLFFHGVACNCVKVQLSHLGLEAEFAQCEVEVDEKDWEGVRRKY